MPHSQLHFLAEDILQAHGHLTISISTIGQAIAILDGGRKVDALFVDLVLHGDEAVKRISPYTTGQGITDEMQALFVENFAFLGKPYTAEVRPL